MKKANLTPHIECSPEDFAKTVLLPGDPLRAKMIAETYLTDAELVNHIRGANGYTGYYHGKRVSVMGSGMGMPSIGLYSYELYHFFNVSSIIRVGSAGAIAPDLKLYDIILAQGACTDSNYFESYRIPGKFAPIADFRLLRQAAEECEKNNISFQVGNILSSDVFYREGGIAETLQWRKMGVLGVEMESAALYMNAARAGKKALTICTVSDLLESGEAASAEERQNAFNDMVKIALAIAE